MKKNRVVYRSSLSVNDREMKFEVYKGEKYLYVRIFDKVENQEIRSLQAKCLWREEIEDSKLAQQLVNRCVQKLKERYKAERGRMELCSRLEMLSSREKTLLYPEDWQAMSTRNSGWAMFRGTTAPIIEKLINGPQTEEEMDMAREEVLQTVLKNQARRSGPETAPNIPKAKLLANRHIHNANYLYESLRKEYPEWGLPPITLREFTDIENVVTEEQCKELPREMMVRLAHLFWRDIGNTPLSLGGIIMLCCMTRTAETCPKFGEIRDMGSYGVYEVQAQVIGGQRQDRLKTKSSRRYIILPKFAMDAIRLRRKMLEDRGCTPEEIREGYVVSTEAEINRPANPGSLSAYIRRMLLLAGYNDASFSAVREELKETDEGGSVQQDIAAYVLRRNGCTYLMNCAPRPVVSGAFRPTLFGLVEALMGHRLGPQDTHCDEWISREDNWPLIAQMMESIVLDPDHSAHPAFSTAEKPGIPDRIVHGAQCVDISKEGCRVYIRRRACDGLEVRVSPWVKVDIEDKIPHPTTSHVHPVQEITDRGYYERIIRQADAIYDQKRREGLI